MSYSSDANQSLSSLTVADLELLVRQMMVQFMQQGIQPKDLHVVNPEALLATFGTWDDDQSAEEIIDVIYASRTHAVNEAEL